MSEAEDEREIRRLQEEWMQAWVNDDRAGLDHILASDYALIVSSDPDRQVSRAEWMAMLPRYSAQGFDYANMTVRLFGDVAVVSSLGHSRGAQVDGADRSGTFFLTDVWTRREGTWQVSSRYSSLPEGRTQSAIALAQPVGLGGA